MCWNKQKQKKTRKHKHNIRSQPSFARCSSTHEMTFLLERRRSAHASRKFILVGHWCHVQTTSTQKFTHHSMSHRADEGSALCIRQAAFLRGKDGVQHVPQFPGLLLQLHANLHPTLPLQPPLQLSFKPLIQHSISGTCATPHVVIHLSLSLSLSLSLPIFWCVYVVCSWVFVSLCEDLPSRKLSPLSLRFPSWR